MLVIRNEQMLVLARSALVERLAGHSREVAPDVCAGMSAAHLRSAAEHCMERCESYGIARDYDILRYMNLMLVFGFTFDRDQPWAAAPLAFRNPSGRMEILMDHALLQVPPSAGVQHAS